MKPRRVGKGANHAVKVRAPRKHAGRPRLDDMAPDGATISVIWSKFLPGASIFIPCVDIAEAIAQFAEIAQRHRWECEYRARIEGGKSGVRFWRIL